MPTDKHTAAARHAAARLRRIVFISAYLRPGKGLEDREDIFAVFAEKFQRGGPKRYRTLNEPAPMSN
jgi:hypothetical protein